MKCGQVRRNCRLTVHFSPLTAAFFSSLGVLRSERTLDRFFLSSNDGQTCPHSLCLPLLGPLSRLQKSRTKAAEEKGRVEILRPLERAFFPLRFSFHSREVKRKERGTRDNTVNVVIDEPAVDVRLCPFGFSLLPLFLLINHSLDKYSITRFLITNFFLISLLFQFNILIELFFWCFVMSFNVHRNEFGNKMKISFWFY